MARHLTELFEHFRVSDDVPKADFVCPAGVTKPERHTHAPSPLDTTSASSDDVKDIDCSADSAWKEMALRSIQQMPVARPESTAETPNQSI